MIKFNGQIQRKRMNNHLLFGMIGDSQITGGVALQADYTGTWPPAYADVSEKTKILYRDNRTTGDQSTVRWLSYSQTADANNNRFPGYGAVGWLQSALAGIDAPFMWYMRQNSNRPVGLLKWALGGTTLLSRSGTDNDWSPSNNEMYRYWAVDYSNLHRRDEVYGSRLRAILVSLGTNDCHTAVWNQTNFINAIPTFVTAIRAISGNTSLPIFWIPPRTDLTTFNPTDYPATNVSQCRAAIADRGAGGSSPITNFFVRDYESDGGTADGVHWDADLCDFIGLDIAAEFLSLYNVP